MASTTRTETDTNAINAHIQEYLRQDDDSITFLAQAYLAIREPTRQKKLKRELKQNPVYPAVSAAIAYSLSEGFYWKKDKVLYSDYDVEDSVAASNAMERHLLALSDLYKITDIVLAQEARYFPQGKLIDSHNLDHIDRTLRKASSLRKLMRHPDVGRNPTPVEKLTMDSIIVQHDSGLPLAGRGISHALVGSVLTPAVLGTHYREPSELVSRIPNEVATGTLYHGTETFDYSGVKTHTEQSAPYAAAVLADESDIGWARTTPECLVQFNNGVDDPWFYLNHFTEDAQWSWDEENRCPQLVFLSVVGNRKAEKDHALFVERLGNRISRPKDMEGYYVSVFAQLLLRREKVALFKSACKALFGKKNYVLKILAADGSILYDHYME